MSEQMFNEGRQRQTKRKVQEAKQKNSDRSKEEGDNFFLQSNRNASKKIKRYGTETKETTKSGN